MKMAKRTGRKRTAKGTITAKARKQFGVKNGSRKGTFPIFYQKSARSAIKLRGKAKSKATRAGILRRAAKYLPGAAKKARSVDRKKTTRKTASRRRRK
jgi:hypothetical protein